MKKLLFLALASIVFASCNLSEESKAEALIEEDMKKALIVVDSYEPVETRLDSAFTPYDQVEFIESAFAVMQYGKTIMQAEEEAKLAKMKMSLYEDSHSMGSYEKNGYEEARSEYNEAVSRIKTTEEKTKKVVLEIRKMLQKKPEFIGYKAIHSYRAKNNAGQIILGRALYVFDKELRNIVATYDMDGEEFKAYERLMQEVEEKN